MSHRINVLVNDDVWESLQKLPKGERSRFINQAVDERFLREKRENAMAEMDSLRRQLPPLNSDIDVLETLRQDRTR